MEKFFKSFIQNDASKGMLLIVATILAMILSNNSLTSETYSSLLSQSIPITIGSININNNILFWTNDCLMVLFFLMIGLEIKHELVNGELVGYNRIIAPIIAALGGMIIPSCIFLLFNYDDKIARNGWAIPSATDIAFTLGVLVLLGNRVSLELRAFIMALAIIDDLGAIIIIMLFYTAKIPLINFSIISIIIACLALLNYCGVRSITVYISIGILLWISMLKAGIHSTLAGVVIGLFIPIKEKSKNSSVDNLLNFIKPWVNWLILPLFAFFNAGIQLNNITLHDMVSNETLGIFFGLLIGKPLGISLFYWLAIKVRLIKLPTNTTMFDIILIGILCGIGFTMSIFISSLAFDTAHEKLITSSKLGILSGSLISAISGYILITIKESIKIKR